MNGIKNLIVGREELAEIFGYSDKYINELVDLHAMPKEDGFNRYNLFDCTKWWIAYQKKVQKNAIEKAKSLKPSDVLAEKNAILKQYEIDIAAKKLIDIDIAEKVIIGIIELFKNSLETIEADYRIRTKGITDEETYLQLNEKLNDIINKIKLNLGSTAINIRELAGAEPARN